MNLNKLTAEIYSIAKPIAIAVLAIWMAIRGLDEKLLRFEAKFDTLTTSVTELNRSVKDLTHLVDDSGKKVKAIESEIKTIKTHVGLK